MTVTTQEAATYAGVTPAVIRKWARHGDLEPLRRDAKPLRFRYEDVVRVQRAKRSKAWVTRHAEARTLWMRVYSDDDMEHLGIRTLTP